MGVFESARFIRLAVVLAVALVLLLSGVVVGAAGGPLLMGAANSAGTTDTSLTTTTTGSALLITQAGTGTALRGTANNGIAGFFLSANGSGVSGVVANNTKYGVYGGNDAATFGGGAAVRAFGNQNNGVIATTVNASADAVRAVNSGGGQALDLVVNAGIAPMSVNSDGLVTNLNADKLDGLDSGAFLPAGDYTVMQQGPWHASGHAAVTIRYFEHLNAITSAAAGSRRIQLALEGPAAIGGIGYGFASARICFASLDSNVTIDATYVFQGSESGTDILVSDETDRASGCYTVTDSTPTLPTGGTTLRLQLQYAAAAEAWVRSVTTTWTPVSP